MGGAERFLWSIRAKARGKRKPLRAATVMKQFLKWHSDADRERWMRSIAPFFWLFTPCFNSHKSILTEYTYISFSSAWEMMLALSCLGLFG